MCLCLCVCVHMLVYPCECVHVGVFGVLCACLVFWTLISVPMKFKWQRTESACCGAQLISSALFPNSTLFICDAIKININEKLCSVIENMNHFWYSANKDQGF